MDYPIEIKVNIDGDPEDALEILELDDGHKRSIWFLEDLTRGPRTPPTLLAAAVIVRVRCDDDGDEADSTAKLRPCRVSDLPPRWAVPQLDGDGWEYRIEGDWTGPRHVLAASLEESIDPASVSSALEPGADLASLVGPRGTAFLIDSAPVPLDIAALTPLGPIRATKWKKVRLDGFKLNVERWEVGSLDFLELSIRVSTDDDDDDEGDRDEGDADTQQRALEESVVGAGLRISTGTESKTQQVLEHLASEATQSVDSTSC